MSHCPDHPKYKGATEIKRLEKCSGCRKVRKAFLAGVEKRKNRGKGSQFSITSPGFRCGVTHLMAELGTVILYGQQPAFFWRANVKADPRAKDHYKKTYNLLNVRFRQNEQMFKAVSQTLWLAWEDSYHKIKRDEEHEISISLTDEEKTAPSAQSNNYSGHLRDVHINPLKYDFDEEEITSGEEKENERRSF